MSSSKKDKKVPSPTLRIFVSHCIDDKKFVFAVCDLLSPYLGREWMFLFEEQPALEGPFMRKIDNELNKAHLILFFFGQRISKYQNYEIQRASGFKKKLLCMVDVGGRKSTRDLPKEVKELLGQRHIIKDQFTTHTPPDLVGCAKEILLALATAKHPAVAGRHLRWDDRKTVDWGVPATPLFRHEKEMIRYFIARQCHDLLRQKISDREALDIRTKFSEILAEWPTARIKVVLAQGGSADWPSVYRYEDSLTPNPLRRDKIRTEFVRAAALTGLEGPGLPLVFLEAGPREKIALPMLPHRTLRVAIVVAGGIAPGINAVIDAIVQRHEAYRSVSAQPYALEVVGVRNGLLGIEPVPGLSAHIRHLTSVDTVEHATRGGSMLGTSRDDQLLSTDATIRTNRMEVIASELRRASIDVLYLIGGDGSMKAAHALWRKVNGGVDNTHRMSVVAVPKTMDNDILWVWQSFGFLSAVEEAREIVERLYTEVRSNPRLGIVQFFGSGSGFVVSHAVLAAATGHATLALIPEVPFSVLGVARYLKQRLWESARPAVNGLSEPAAPIDQSIPHGLIVMAETAIPVDALECLGIKEPPSHLKSLYDAVAREIQPSKKEREAVEEFISNGRRVQGQTSDALRSLGIRILIEALPVLLKSNQLSVYCNTQGHDEPDWTKLRMVRNEPRYLVRALEPSTSDIINGQRLGLLAVDAAMAGYTDCMVSQWLTEFTVVPLELVVQGRKRIPREGMFWKSVAAKTRQDSFDIVHPFPEL